MPTSCGVVTQNIQADCENKPVGGAESEIIVINKADYDEAVKVFDSTNPGILRSITLKTGKKGYSFTVFKRGHKPKFETQDSEYGARYKHSIATNIPVWDTKVKSQLQALADGYYVVIVENVQKTGDSVFEVYGASNGLRMPDGVRDLSANEGVFTGTLTNDEDMNEPKPPLTFAVEQTNVYSYSATKTAVSALLVAAS